MLNWYKDLKLNERRAFWSCFGGWSLDAFDVQVYSFTIPTLIAIWGISNAQAGQLGTVTLLLSAFGGWTTGLLSDRYGRVRMLQVTIFVFAVFTFGTSSLRILDNYSSVAHCKDWASAVSGQLGRFLLVR